MKLSDQNKIGLKPLVESPRILYAWTRKKYLQKGSKTSRHRKITFNLKTIKVVTVDEIFIQFYELFRDKTASIEWKHSILLVVVS